MALDEATEAKASFDSARRFAVEVLAASPSPRPFWWRDLALAEIAAAGASLRFGSGVQAVALAERAEAQIDYLMRCHGRDSWSAEARELQQLRSQLQANASGLPNSEPLPADGAPAAPATCNR